MPLNQRIATDLIAWIQTQEFYTRNKQQPNYAVGITDGDKIIVSKVGGVTSGTDGIGVLDAAVRSADWWTTAEGLYFAQKYSTAVDSSNHGEMCVLAAADALGDRLLYIACTGDNCPACATMLAAAGVQSLNRQTTGSQAGWVHPRLPMALGSQINTNWKGQIEELNAYNATPPAQQSAFPFKLTMKLSSYPKGRYESVA